MCCNETAPRYLHAWVFSTHHALHLQRRADTRGSVVFLGVLEESDSYCGSQFYSLSAISIRLASRSVNRLSELAFPPNASGVPSLSPGLARRRSAYPGCVEKTAPTPTGWHRAAPDGMQPFQGWRSGRERSQGSARRATPGGMMKRRWRWLLRHHLAVGLPVKLCFGGVDRLGADYPDATPRKQSIQDNRMTKQA